jgi:hypothetical protein
VVLGLAVLGVLLFDAGSIAANFFGVDSVADDIAVKVSTLIGSDDLGTTREIETKARQLARDAGVRLVTVRVQDGPQNDVVVVRIRRKATTIVVSRIGAIEDWAVATAKGRATNN